MRAIGQLTIAALALTVAALVTGGYAMAEPMNDTGDSLTLEAAAIAQAKAAIRDRLTSPKSATFKDVVVARGPIESDGDIQKIAVCGSVFVENASGVAARTRFISLQDALDGKLLLRSKAAVEIQDAHRFTRDGAREPAKFLEYWGRCMRLSTAQHRKLQKPR